MSHTNTQFQLPPAGDPRLADAIRARRLQKGLSRYQLSKAVGSDGKGPRRWETGTVPTPPFHNALQRELA